MKSETQIVVEAYFKALASRTIDGILAVISEDIDWYVPGNSDLAPWLGKRSTKTEIEEFYSLLWAATEPISVNIGRFIIEDDYAIITGEFSSKMLQTGNIVESIFFIEIVVADGLIIKYRLLEDSNAVVEALTK